MADSFGSTGGGEIIVAYLARQLRERHDVAILTAGDGPSAHTSWEGLEIFHVASHYRTRLRPIRSILNSPVIGGVRDALRSFRPDVVHAWNVHHHLSYEALRQARLSGAPVVHTSQDAMAFCYTKFHCWIDPLDPRGADAAPRALPQSCRNCRGLFWMFPPRNRLTRAYLNRFVTIPVSVSEALNRALVANRLREARVLHNGIPAADFVLDQAATDSARESLGLPAGPIVLAGGRLGHFKGHQRALEAFREIAAAHPTATLAMMGAPSWYSDHLAEQARKMGISAQVRFTGLLPRSAIPGMLSIASTVLNLSMYLDPFPTMNLEAMAASRTVIGTCFGGTPEAVDDGHTGFIVNPYQTSSIAERLTALLDEPGLAESMGAAGRHRSIERFTIERMADDYTRLYEEARSAGVPAPK